MQMGYTLGISFSSFYYIIHNEMYMLPSASGILSPAFCSCLSLRIRMRSFTFLFILKNCELANFTHHFRGREEGYKRPLDEIMKHEI